MKISASTMSTGLNSMSGVIYVDMIKPLLKKPMSQVGASRIMKMTVIIIGIICVGLVFLVEKLSGLIQVCQINRININTSTRRYKKGF